VDIKEQWGDHAYRFLPSEKSPLIERRNNPFRTLMLHFPLHAPSRHITLQG
jgi:hypothetical protein